MQRIAEEHDPGDGQVGIFRRHVRGRTAAHRFASDEKTFAGAGHLRACEIDDGAIARHELRHPIGNLAPLLHVEEIERQHIDPAFAQRAREGHHERMALRCPGAVREDEGGGSTRLDAC